MTDYNSDPHADDARMKAEAKKAEGQAKAENAKVNPKTGDFEGGTDGTEGGDTTGTEGTDGSTGGTDAGGTDAGSEGK